MNALERDLVVLKQKMVLLTSNSAVRRLLASVAQNPSDETFVVPESQTTITNEILAIEKDFIGYQAKMGDQELKNHVDLRIASDLITAVLIDLQTLFCSPQCTPDDIINNRIRERWLFENLTRLKKWLIVAKVLAHQRLASFKNSNGTNVVPTPADTPTHIMELWIVANNFEKRRQPEIRAEYMTKIADHVPLEFLALGYGDSKTSYSTALRFMEEHCTNSKRMTKK